MGNIFLKKSPDPKRTGDRESRSGSGRRSARSLRKGGDRHEAAKEADAGGEDCGVGGGA